MLSCWHVTSPTMVAILAAILDFTKNQVKTARNGSFCALHENNT